MNSLIKQYIDRLTTEDIKNFATKQNVHLSDNEANALFYVVKNHYQEILSGNDGNVRKYLKEHLSEQSFNTVISLYEEYRLKYQGYLW